MWSKKDKYSLIEEYDYYKFIYKSFTHGTLENIKYAYNFNEEFEQYIFYWKDIDSNLLDAVETCHMFFDTKNVFIFDCNNKIQQKIDTIYKWIIDEGIPVTQIIMIGDSYGSYAACYLTYLLEQLNNIPIKGLILISPIDCAFKRLSYLNNIKYIKQLTCIVVIFHGKKDKIINYKCSKNIYKNLNKQIINKSCLITATNREHYDLFDSFTASRYFFEIINHIFEHNYIGDKYMKYNNIQN